ncbi:MAG TPA: sodium-dependent bicarbonate transport family permease [Acidobacteriota bacterium]|nr:sodium-dependent bicarbonate transport family permease [Acidobacteriota bacterium]
MEVVGIILGQISSLPILFFALGMFAGLVKSDLKIPADISMAMLLFLLAAIGLEGGVGIAKAGVAAVWAPAMASVFLGVSIVLLGFTILTRLKFDFANAGAIAGHYGAVSAATMVAGFAFLEKRGTPFEVFVPALYPLMDSPAIITAIFLTRFALAKAKAGADVKLNKLGLFKEAVLGKAILLLGGSLIIGYIVGYTGTKTVMPFFDGMFAGILCLFMLDMGIVAAARLNEWKTVGARLLAFALIMPPIHGLAGVLAGSLVGLSAGGAAMLGVMAGSASYISAPAAMRAAIPEANPSLSLTAVLALTFPFNVTIGIPLYYSVAHMASTTFR